MEIEKGWDFSGTQDSIFSETGMVAEQNRGEDSKTLGDERKFVKKIMLCISRGKSVSSQSEKRLSV